MGSLRISSSDNAPMEISIQTGKETSIDDYTFNASKKEVKTNRARKCATLLLWNIRLEGALEALSRGMDTSQCCKSFLWSLKKEAKV